MAQRRLVALFLILFVSLGSSVAWSDILKDEHVGQLKLGMSEASLKAVMGAPSSKTPMINEAATGLYVVTWNYPNRGISATLSASQKGGPWSLDRLSVTPPCKFKTARGAGIGDTRERVQSLYAKDINKSDGEGNPEHLVVGSIYGGLIFTFKSGRVVEIFLGAAAE